MNPQIDKDRLVVYETEREKVAKRGASIAFFVFFCLLVAHAVSNAYSGDTARNDTILTNFLFGFVLVFLLVVLLLSPPKSKQSKNSDECLIADTQGVVIANPGVIPTQYAWSQIEKILLTKKLAFSGNTHSVWFVIIVYFKKRHAMGSRERLYQGIQTSPEGFDIRFVYYPEKEKESIRDALFRLSPKSVPVESFRKIVFRRGRHTEDYIA